MRRVNLCRFGGQRRGGREAAGALSCGSLLPGGRVGIDAGKPGSCRWSGPCSSVSGCLAIFEMIFIRSFCFCNVHVFWVALRCVFCFFIIYVPTPLPFPSLYPSAWQQLKTVGVALSLRMTEHSSDLWLGFGSFVDKPVSPYINVHPSKINNPCR